jgi:hypothetical protein
MPRPPEKPPGRPRKIGWLAAWRGGYLRYPTVVALIVANLVPLFGVLFWGWDLFVLMMAYWMETGVIGFWAILQMALVARWQALMLVPFFIIHFGGFMVGHLLFLVMLFGSRSPDDLQHDPLGFAHEMLIGKGLWVALAALFVSHGVSFVINFLLPWWRGTWERPKNPQDAMMAPYGRVIVMHVTVLIGAALAQFFQTKTAAFVLLIALKIFVDVSSHIRKNFKPDEGAGRLTTA